MQNNNLSKEEATTYDRQIRLWGRDTQSKIRSARILIIGLGGIGTEVAKNLALSGFGHIKLKDDKVVEQHHLGANFFLRENHVGTNRAQATQAGVQELNPMVVVEADPSPIDSLNVETLSGTTFVVCDGLSRHDEERVGELCRQAHVCVTSAHSFGFCAVFTQDLGPSFTYTPDKVAGEDKTPDPVTIEYCPIAQINNTNQVRLRVSKVWLAANAVRRMEASENVVEEAIKFATTQHPKLALTDQITEIANNQGRELGPICAVIGGLIGQEAVKIVSGVGCPVQNVFSFHASDAKGVVDKIGV